MQTFVQKIQANAYSKITRQQLAAALRNIADNLDVVTPNSEEALWRMSVPSNRFEIIGDGNWTPDAAGQKGFIMLHFND